MMGRKTAVLEPGLAYERLKPFVNSGEVLRLAL